VREGILVRAAGVRPSRVVVRRGGLAEEPERHERHRVLGGVPGEAPLEASAGRSEVDLTLRRSLETPPRIVVGLDLSLTGSGIAILPSDWHPGDWGRVAFERLTEAGEKSGPERVEAIVNGVVAAVVLAHARVGEDRSDFPPWVGVEEHAFSKFAQKHAFARAELVGAVKHQLHERGVYVAAVVASHARKVFLGPLPRMARKEIKDHLAYVLGGMGAPAGEWGEDVIDAFVIANCLRGERGMTCLSPG
jgi:hypothetical protein